MPYRPGFFIWAAMCLTVATLAWSGNALQEEHRVSISPRPTAHVDGHSHTSLRSDVNLVLVPVSVLDALDRPVTSLPRESFRVWEDGVEQTVTYFSQEEGPVSLGLAFDSSGSMKKRIETSVEALKLLFQTTLPSDEFFVVQFSDQPRLLGGFTADPAEIQRRLGLVQAKGWTALLDALALSAHQMRSARNGRRVLLILSDGNDNNSRFTESEIRNRVIEGNLRIYGIGLFHWPRFLQQLAQETGGHILSAQSLTELPDTVQRLSREIRSEYVLGYSSGNPQADGKYRKVKVELLQPPGALPLRHSWRRGYYAPAK